MNDDSADNDNQEKLVIEEVFKDVVLITFQFSSIDLVENLKKDEDVEENRVMFTSFIVPVSNSD